MALICNELKPDVFIITEHGFKNESINFLKIENYELSTFYIRNVHKGGGVAVFVKKSILFSEYKTTICMEKDFEAAGIYVNNIIGSKILIIGLYRSPSGNNNEFFMKLDTLLNNLTLKAQKFILIGDFNINVLENNKAETLILKDLLKTYNLEWFINSPTRVTATSATAIDNVISNITNMTVSLIVTAVADHDAQLVTIDDWSPEKHPDECYFRRLTTFKNIRNLKRSLEKLNWNFLDDYKDAGKMYEKFSSIFLHHLNICCPLHKTLKQNKSNTNTWITKGILVSRKNLKFYYKKK